jgi:Domain of unknown function (DUF4145)
MTSYNWNQPQTASSKSYKCGYCDKDVAPSYGYFAARSPRTGEGNIYICPNCGQPTFFSDDHKQTPGPRYGNNVPGISKPEVATLYKEARDCASAGAYTPAVMACRKILMNLAVSFGAEEDKSFAYYVDFLANKGFVPPQGKEWITAIKDRGNDANHQIQPMNDGDAKIVLHFTEALMRFNYELPSVLEADQQRKNQTTQ